MIVAHAMKLPQSWDIESDQLGVPAVFTGEFPGWSRWKLEQADQPRSITAVTHLGFELWTSTLTFLRNMVT